MIYSAQKPPLTTTYPVVSAIKISKDLQTLLDLQALGITAFHLDIGAPGSPSLSIRFDAPSGPLVVYLDNILVVSPGPSYEIFPDQAAFLSVYDVI